MPPAAKIRRALLAWYHRNKRDLPWRKTRDPYRIWVSEVMLQQTRVAAVLPYYERFLARFPTVGALADAPEQDVLASWAGLGYYSRARNLQRAAREIQRAGQFPSEYHAIRRLSGIGDYTAAAVASIAFDLPHAAVDGNALRVLSRLTAEPGEIGSPGARSRLQGFASELLERNRPGDFNQALMELGATVCLPRTPQCLLCPVSNWCEAHARGRAADFPIRVKQVRREEVLETLCYVERNTRILLWQRPDESRRMAGFWELPRAAQLPRARIENKLGEFRHTIVNTTYCFTVVRASLRAAPPGFGWIANHDLNELPLSTTAKKALRCLTKHGG